MTMTVDVRRRRQGRAPEPLRRGAARPGGRTRRRKPCCHARRPAPADGLAAARRVESAFVYFLERQAPVSGAAALHGLPVHHRRTASTGRGVTLGVRVPVTSVCPCSKAISDYGAHNQRGHITIDVDLAERRRRPRSGRRTHRRRRAVRLVAAVPAAEAPGRAARDDGAHDNPVFVEDMARNVVARCATTADRRGSASRPSTTRASTTTPRSRVSSLPSAPAPCDAAVPDHRGVQ